MGYKLFPNFTGITNWNFVKITGLGLDFFREMADDKINNGHGKYGNTFHALNTPNLSRRPACLKSILFLSLRFYKFPFLFSSNFE